MRLLGSIVQLQYQRDHLKYPYEKIKLYDPTNIVAVDALRCTVDGVEAGPVDQPVIDVHHRLHTRSRNRGDNGISIGFTSHYAIMRERFGDRLVDGVAGENIIVACDRPLSEADVADGFVVETLDGPVSLVDVIAAPPCVEFSRYALDFPVDAKPDRTVTEAVQFLSNGVRGFYAGVVDVMSLRVGDRVYIHGES